MKEKKFCIQFLKKACKTLVGNAISPRLTSCRLGESDKKISFLPHELNRFFQTPLLQYFLFQVLHLYYNPHKK